MSVNKLAVSLILLLIHRIQPSTIQNETVEDRVVKLEKQVEILQNRTHFKGVFTVTENIFSCTFSRERHITMVIICHEKEIYILL